MKKFLALLLAAMMLLGMTSAFAEATDTITVMVPPVTGTYLDDIDTWANDFMAEHPEIKVEVIKTSWDDHNSKLNTMANARRSARHRRGQLFRYRHLRGAGSGRGNRPVHGRGPSGGLRPERAGLHEPGRPCVRPAAVHHHSGAGRQQGHAGSRRRGRGQGADRRLDL